jgi:diguanylate cyclase (GGDEF)-like protein
MGGQRTKMQDRPGDLHGDSNAAVRSGQQAALGDGASQGPDPLDMARVLDVLCPMHLLLGPTGEVLHAGPTLARLRPQTPLCGASVLDLFEVTRPRQIAAWDDLRMLQGKIVHLAFRDHPTTAFKGCLAATGQGMVLNLSFGISIMDALRDYALTAADFAATDMTVELLYLFEAKSAAMEESRKLNQRLRGAMVAAEAQALTDTLTGLANRRALDHLLERLCHGREPFAVMHLDLDHFKAVNDTLGHAAGDHVLRHVAIILTEETRSGDTVARIGGDEFVLVFPKLRDRALLEAIAQRIIMRLGQPIPYCDALCRISGSIGTVLSDNYDRLDPGHMMADADVALYRSKHAGRGRHEFFHPLTNHD